MRFKKAGSLLAVMAAAVLLDRLSKAWAVRALYLRPCVELWPGVLRLRYAENTGAAFSMLSDSGSLLIALTALILTALAFWLVVRHPGGSADWGLALILAGGLSNLYDRLAHGFVVDFIEPVFMRFAVFNLADTWVCAGALLVLLGTLLRERRRS